MGGIDKRLAPLGGRPLLIRTLEAIAGPPVVAQVVLVMDSGPALEAIRAQLPAKVAAVVAGGPHRGASVEAGFRALEAVHGGTIDEDRVVLIHDGARPLVSAQLIEVVATGAAEHGAAIPLVAVADTVRRVRDGVVGDIVDRTDLMAAQTPQAARAGLLKRAFRAFPSSGRDRFTDEAALLMACTIRVHPVPGDPVNLKVTLPDDLARVDAVLASRAPVRVGHGVDTHPFGPGEGLRLGGIEIPGAPRLHGHSDGDVALHAIADALLGAAALGDLGRLFPADHRTPRGADSSTLVEVVIGRLAEAGWDVDGVDLTITGVRPHLGPHLDAIQARIAALLGIPTWAVGVKASTGNLEGGPGAGRSMAASATVTVRSRSGLSAGDHSTERADREAVAS
ncbi:MAG: 2-C-methyl-D-erythritol 2,4-cyclodiphosphate synthase [Chloroflexi bacterium]|nr:2-C-methyl-D-erythritol 2,4-cyclodiphosphate synthase [Chloroflexota bacterium]